MKETIRLPFVLLLCAGLITACGDDDDMDELHKMDFRVTLYNLSANQPMTPPAVILHHSNYSPWALGAAASSGLERLAEGGDTTSFVNSAKRNDRVYATAAGNEVFLPGGSTSIDIGGRVDEHVKLSIASMLANTNDAFAGAAGIDLSEMDSGQSKSLMLRVMDAGTEANSEASGSIPGPVDGGEGYNAARDDLLDKVHIHAGVVSVDDGVSASVLDESHRWNGPVARLVITRL